MAETPEIDAQDVAEVFDEDNTNLDRRDGREDAEQFEDLPSVFDSTRAVGDEDDDDAEIGEDMDDDDIVESATDRDEDELEDDVMDDRDGGQPRELDDLDEVTDIDAVDDDDVDAVDARDPDEVELAYAGGLNNVAGGASSAADMESDELSDQDLRDLDYKEDAK